MGRDFRGKEGDPGLWISILVLRFLDHSGRESSLLPQHRGSTNTEPEADRGPRAGSPRGVVVAPGLNLRNGRPRLNQFTDDTFRLSNHLLRAIAYIEPGRYRSR